MARRKIIEIDEDKCTGCGACVTKCAEGALEVIHGKARVVNEVFCDGLGACIGECPEDALRIVEREAPGFDEIATERHLRKGDTTGHQKHLDDENCGCTSHQAMVLTAPRAGPSEEDGSSSRGSPPPELGNWPVQWRLVSSAMPFFEGRDLLLAADCVPFAYRDFHGRFLMGRSLVIGCPKLDDQKSYLEKLVDIFRDTTPRAVEIAIMEVPCCNGLRRLVDEAIRRAGKKIPVRATVVSIKGDILKVQ